MAEADNIREMKAKLEQDRIKELEHEKALYEKSIAYKEALHGQLEDVENRKQAEYEQFLKEKAMVDAVVAKIMEEDERLGFPLSPMNFWF